MNGSNKRSDKKTVEFKFQELCPKDDLVLHRTAYQQNFAEMNKQRNDLMQIDEILKFFKTNKVKITKLNHSLDKST